MALYSFEVRESEDGKRIGRVFVAGSSAEVAGNRAAKWAATEDFHVADCREAEQLLASAPDDYLIFKSDK